MRTKVRLLITLLILSGLNSYSEGPEGFNESASVDREQQQLEWCFVYSNILGYNITYISNPRLYQSISEWMGTPYKYSGNNKNGIDCSSLVSKLYQSCYDKTVDGSARDLFKLTDPVRRSDLNEGDLVFFKIKKNRISHVGVYLGQNKFVHSSSQLGVTISDLDDPYYQKFFFKGGRVK